MGHPQVIEDQAGISSQHTHGLGDAAYAFGFDDRDGEAAEPGDVFGAVPRRNSASVFIVVPVKDVVAAVFDTPVAAVRGENACCVGLNCGVAGHAIGDVAGDLAGLFLRDVTFYDESLSYGGEVEIVVEFCCGPDFSDFDPAMLRRVDSNIIGGLSIFEIHLDGFKNSGLVGFDGEVIIGSSFGNDVFSELSLGQ